MNSYLQDDKLVVVLPKKLELDNCENLPQFIAEKVGEGYARLVADAKNMEYMDSSGISQLLKCMKNIQHVGGELIIKNLRGQPLEVINQAGLNRILNIEGTGSGAAEGEAAKHVIIKEEVLENTHVVSPVGALYYPYSTQEFRDKLRYAVLQGKNLIIDCEELEYMDSHSVNEILQANYKLKNIGCKIRFCCVNEIMMEMLETLNINAIIQIFPTRGEALEDF